MDFAALGEQERRVKNSIYVAASFSTARGFFVDARVLMLEELDPVQLHRWCSFEHKNTKWRRNCTGFDSGRATP